MHAVALFCRPATQQIPAAGIRHSEGIATLSVAAAKPAFEVRTPDLIGGRRVCQWLAPGRCFAMPAPGMDQPFPLEQFSHAAGRRPTVCRGLPPQTLQNLAGSPGRTLL